jgi:hypothetical protein
MMLPDGGIARTGHSAPTHAPAPPPVPLPARVDKAPNQASSASGAGNGASSTSTQQTPLATAAVNTQQKVMAAAQANENVMKLENLPPAIRSQVGSDVSAARDEAKYKNAEAKKAVHDELAVAKEVFSPSYFDDYKSAMARDFADHSGEATLVREAINADATAAPTEPPLTPIESKEKEVAQAEARYNEVARSVEGAPAHIKDLALQSVRAALETKRTELAQLQAPDPKAEAKRILEVGKRSGHDDYQARIDAYGESLSKGDATYRKELLAEILKQDSGALQSWLKPEEINNAADSARISSSERGMMADTFAAAYNDGLIPTQSTELHSNSTATVNTTDLDSLLDPYDSPSSSSTRLQAAKDTAEFLEFINSAGSTPETREFRQKFAQHLVDDYALNDENLNDGQEYAAARLAAQVISGDKQAPELAQIFMSSLDAGGRLDSFLEKVEAGSTNLAADLSGGEAEENPNYNLDEIRQPDAFSQLVNCVAETDGADADRLAVKLGHYPGDHGRWLDNSSERADAWTNLFNGHSEVILNDLTNPDGLPVSKEGKVEPAFQDRAHDLGAYLKLINGGDDTAKIEEARGKLIDYASGLKEEIAGASKAEDAVENGRRLGFLGAAVTESVNQGFRDYAESQEQKKALIGFALDLVISAIPVGGILNDKVGDWLNENIGSAVFKEALKGFAGNVIDTEGKITDAAKDYILNNLDEGDIETLIVKLQDSNDFIRDTLFKDLPGPGYNKSETGRENTIQNVQSAYDIALVWLAK